ncbi:unnamed protein product [Amoebophrya sp. A120]|nr:unnamed protein product [Amoebophrya sp. A120]|eukprot:GSA120T00008816001.1
MTSSNFFTQQSKVAARHRSYPSAGAEHPANNEAAAQEHADLEAGTDFRHEAQHSLRVSSSGRNNTGEVIRDDVDDESSTLLTGNEDAAQSKKTCWTVAIIAGVSLLLVGLGLGIGLPLWLRHQHHLRDGNSIPPKVYVYNLPDQQMLNGREIVWREDAYCERAFPSGSAEERDCVFGPEFSVEIQQGPGQPATTLTLRSTDQFRNGRIWQSRLTRTAFRVEDPTLADVFFVPIWRESYKPDQSKCPTADEVLAALPHLTDATASKHILLSPRVGGLFDDVCSFWNSKEPLIQKMRKVALEDYYSCGGNRPERAIPYPTLGAGLTATQLEQLFATVDETQQAGRPRLVMAAIGPRPPGAASAKIRHIWNDQCKDSDQCVHVDPTKPDMLPGLVEAMITSTFCLQPVGDTPSRKGLLDGLALGCIPVLSSPKQQKLWRWHLLEGEDHNQDRSWDDFSVLAPDDSSKTVIEFLQGINPETISKLQAGGRIARRKIITHWSGTAENDDDAIAVTLKAIQDGR